MDVGRRHGVGRPRRSWLEPRTGCRARDVPRQATQLVRQRIHAREQFRAGRLCVLRDGILAMQHLLGISLRRDEGVRHAAVGEPEVEPVVVEHGGNHLAGCH